MNPPELRRLMTAKAEEARALYESAKTENRAVTPEEDTKYKALIAEAKSLQVEADRLEELEGFKGVNKEGVTPSAHQRKTPDTAEGIFCRYVRTGDPGAQRELNPAVVAEARASNDTTMNITTAADGGDLVPVGHYQGIIAKARPQALYSVLGVRDIPGKGTTINVPVDDETDDGRFVATAESAAWDRDAPAISQLSMTLVKYTKKIDLTYELLQDEDSRLMDFLANWVAGGFAATMNYLMLTEALTNGTAGLTFAAATAIGASEIPALLYKLPSAYARGPGVAWVMNRAAEGFIRGIYSSSQFSFSPNPGATGQGGIGSTTLWGVPVYNDDNMGALAASGKSAIIGNWNWMGMRLDPGMTFLRDPYTRSSFGEVVLNYYFRVDFAVLMASAFQYGTQPSA